MKPQNRITPKHIDALKENEVIVFGYNELHNGSAIAIERFGHILISKEALLSKCIGVPIGFIYGGNTDELNRSAIKTFIEYAAQNPQLHFLVTDKSWPSVHDVAEKFLEAMRLPNVSLPRSFWNEYDLLDIRRPSFWYRPLSLYKRLMTIYKYGEKNTTYGWQILWEEPRIYMFKHLKSHKTYLVNGDTKEVVEMVDRHGNVRIFSQADIRFDAIDDEEHRNQLLRLKAPYGIGIWGFNKDGVSLVRWGVGGLNEFNCPNACVDGFIDTDFRVVVPFQYIEDPFNEDNSRLANSTRQQIKDKKSIWR